MTFFPAICLDTETSGMFDWKKPADADGQPRMAALSAALIPDEVSPPIIYTTLIKPDGWVMSEEAFAKNRLTMERLEAEGVPIDTALDVFQGFYAQAPVLVGFNINFDTKVLRAEWRRAGQPDRFGEKLEACVMRASRPLCGLGKSPTLIEACQILLGEEHPDAHDAEADMLKTAALYRHLVARGAITPAHRPTKETTR